MVFAFGARFMHQDLTLYINSKKCIRFIFNLPYSGHTAELFKEYNILTISQIYMFKIALFAYKFLNNILPTNFNDFFHPVTSTYSQRHAYSFKIQPARINLKRYSLRCLGPHVWNVLPTDLKLRSHQKLFMKSCKHYFIDNDVFNISLLNGIYYLVFKYFM